MPYEVYRVKTQQRDIIDHYHCLTMKAALANAAALCAVLGADETVGLVCSDKSIVMHLPDETSPTGEDIYFPHWPPPPYERTAALSIYDTLLIAVLRTKQLGRRELVELRGLIEHRAKDMPQTSAAMMSLLDAALNEMVPP
jgi:hypothetical protein